MKKIASFILVFVMIFSVIAVAASAEDKEVLVFGTSADYAPFEFMYPDENGTMVYGGIDILVAQYIADYLGMELQIENMDFGYLLTALNKGDFDMVLADIEPTEKRQKAADFSDGYYQELPEMFLVRAEDVELFNDAAFVDVVAVSKGHGYQGVVKRHGFGGVGQQTHGQHNRGRKPGSIGACSYPAKVFKGMRMAGHMGTQQVTTQNLQVLKVIPEHNLLLIKGSIPGYKGSIVSILR